MSRPPQENWREESVPEEAPEIDFLQYWRTVQRRSRLLVSIVAAVLLLTVVQTLLTPPSYQARALLDLEKDVPGLLDFGQSTPLYMPDLDYYRTQYNLLESRGLAERIVTRLRLAERPDFNPSRAGFWKASPWKAPGAGTAPAAGQDLLTGLAERVQRMTAVRPIRGTHLVTIESVASSPKLAADLANGLAEAFIEWNLENRSGKTSDAARYLEAQAEQLKSELETKKKQLGVYGATSNIVSADPQGNLTLQKLEAISRDYAVALADRITKEARYSEVRTAPPASIADTLSPNGLVTQLRAEQARAEREYAQKLSVFKPEWPAMQQLAAQIEKGREHLRSVIEETVQKARGSAKADYDAALQREQSLLSVLDQQKRQAVHQTSESAEYNSLLSEVQVKQTLLDALLKRQGETSVDSELMGRKDSAVRIVDRALVPHERYRPSLRRNLFVGAFFGFVLAFATIFLLDHFDRSLKSAEDVERWIGLPSLGVIPSVSEEQEGGYGYGYGSPRPGKRKSRDRAPAASPAAERHVEFVPMERPRSSAAEAYRSARTALLLSSADRLQTVLVTSALPGEGKTSTALNLAVVLSQLDKSVLLIDADMRHPRIHEVMRISNRLGLVSYLTGQVKMEEVSFETRVPNLSVVPSGPAPPNPAELLSSARMTGFVEAARKTYDFIVFDSAPLMLVTDAVVTGMLCDGTILCAHGGKTPRDVVRRAGQVLGRSGVRVFGVLLNNLPARYSAGRYYGGKDDQGRYAGYYVEEEGVRADRVTGKGTPA